jgi:hypothetical protein
MDIQGMQTIHGNDPDAIKKLRASNDKFISFKSLECDINTNPNRLDIKYLLTVRGKIKLKGDEENCICITFNETFGSPELGYSLWLTKSPRHQNKWTIIFHLKGDKIDSFLPGLATNTGIELSANMNSDELVFNVWS